jgi:hypothetical protein
VRAMHDIAEPLLSCDIAAHSLAAMAETLQDANINPRTGLATDYLNHFNEIIMLLELYPSCPDVLADIVSWQPLNYREHFECSGFRERELAILAYQLSPPIVRKKFDALVAELSTVLLEAQRELSIEREHEQAIALIGEVSRGVETLLAQAGALINGFTGAGDVNADTAQAAVDALFEYLPKQAQSFRPATLQTPNSFPMRN